MSDFTIGENVSVFWEKQEKGPVTMSCRRSLGTQYEAKITDIKNVKGVPSVKIHYLNWNKRFDEWVPANSPRLVKIKNQNSPIAAVVKELKRASTMVENTDSKRAKSSVAVEKTEEAHYTRDQHGEFQNLIERLVHKILRETDIVDTDNADGRKLFNFVDTFFSYGLLTADGTYWRFISQFLPCVEQRMIIFECPNANDRVLSIEWLKTSFNKGTLYFLLFALTKQISKIDMHQFYHINSCLRNDGLVEAVTELMERLSTVQFAFKTSRQLRQEPLPSAVVEPCVVQDSSRAAARQRKLTGKEASQEVVPNRISTEVSSLLTQAIEQDILLDELVRTRNHRLNTDTIKQSFVRVKQEEPEMPECNLADGEFQMSQRDALHLAINVFEKSSEKIITCFKVLEKFHSDCIKLRFFVMTNYNSYVFDFRHKTHLGSPGTTTNLSSEGFFIPMIRMAHDRIKAIKVGIDNLSFVLEANENGFSHFIENVERDDKTVFTYTAALAGLECGASFINTLGNIIEQSNPLLTERIMVDSKIGYMRMLQPNLKKLLSRAIDIRSAALCFWYEQSYAERVPSMTTKSGYLFKTIAGVGMRRSQIADERYCVIVRNSLHVFLDSNCQREDVVINLSTATMYSTGRVTFQLRGPEGHFEFESSCQKDYAEWMTVLGHVMENKATPENMTPCLTVLLEGSIAVVQEGETFWADGFLRLLNEIPGDSFQQVIVVYPSKYKGSFTANCAPAFCLVTGEQSIHYFFLRFTKELERFTNSIEVIYGLKHRKLDEPMMQTPVGKTIHNTCCLAKNLWPI
ncbi:hypothetical protein GCK72_026018 [Caenorhabditis remanei]|uniref:PH domain-containing protein n=1 Tax=Caenorhabditis remanei TaxID=31234 RepID=A0A6A5G3R0_CAERE|nr:hypothetical protein GCK72_026018 [Caenorhabditis remanei]KAF1749550.1 hypothetical protein GCK72_026018 [Caenorhabditis remanei]